jgi:hypothetical protein
MVRPGDDQMARWATQAQPNEHDLLTEVQAHEQELPMSLAWFRRKRIHGGGPPFIRISNRVFYRRGELRRWIAARATPVAAPQALAAGRAVGARN